MTSRLHKYTLSALITLFLTLPAFAGEQMKSFTSVWSTLDKVPFDVSETKPEKFRRQLVKGHTLDLAKLHIFAETIPAGAAAPARVKPDYFEELMIVQKGELKVSVADSKVVTYGPGSVVVTMPGEKREFTNAGNGAATYYIFNYRSHLPPNISRAKQEGGSIMVDWDNVEYVASDIGGRRDMFDRPTAMFERFEMHVSTVNKGLTNHPAHTHRAEEFVLMIEGEVAMLVGDETVKASAGDLVYLESMIPHSLNNTGKGATTYFAFQFWQ